MAFISQSIEEYVLNHSSKESELLQHLSQETHATMAAPHMMVGPVPGQLLHLLAKLMAAKEILEIGMFTGYSTLMLAAALPENGRIITCEINPQAEAIAKKYFAQSPHGHKIDIRMGEALATLKNLHHSIDMVFIDADKANNGNYYDLCFPLVKAGGLIVVDNTLWDGEVVQPEDKQSKIIAEFNDKIQADSRVEKVCLTVRDGITLIYKHSTQTD